MQFIHIPERRWTTPQKVSFKRTTPDSVYIRILKVCSKPATLAEIYPDVKHPFADQVTHLSLNGYLDKLSIEKHIYHHEGFFDTYSKVWYQTTEKGQQLVKQICG